MLNLKKVAVTGSIASGKSTVCDFFRGLGAEVVSADAIVHQLLSTDSHIIKTVAELIAQDVLVNGQVDRSRVAKAVFGNPELLKSLEKLLHPAVKKAIDERYTQANMSGRTPLFIVEIPLLFEIGDNVNFDATICVIAKDENRRKRYQHNDFDLRQKNQWPQDRKVEHATYVIENNGTLEELHQKTEELFKKLINPII